MNYLFEVSWQVCNKVGGINTVINSKAYEAIKEYKDRYILFGPLLDENQDFLECKDDEFLEIKNVLNDIGIHYKVGKLNIKGDKPLVILIDYKNRYEVNKLLYSYWKDFGIDSYGAELDFIEPALFGTAVGEAVVSLYKKLITNKNDKMILHCHEWKTGTTLLYVKKHVSEIGTVFTPHSTTVARVLANKTKDLSSELDNINATQVAKTYGVAPRHLLESAAVTKADCVTTISEHVSKEIYQVYDKKVDFTIGNALSYLEKDDNLNDKNKKENREFLLDFCRKFLKKDLPENTRIFLMSGRCEFENKGYDVFLEALAKLNDTIKSDASLPPVVALFLVSAGDKGVHDSVRKRVKEGKTTEGTVGITTHRLNDEGHNPIVDSCYRLGLQNAPENKVNIIFSPAFLDGLDGAFDKTYLEILRGVDLGVFPSLYEPWGYAPLESMAEGVPAITSDVSGIAEWAMSLKNHDGLYLLGRKGKSKEEVIDSLEDILLDFLKKTQSEISALNNFAYSLARKANWKDSFHLYIDVYNKSLEVAEKRFDILDSSDRQIAKDDRNAKPYYRSFSVVSDLPEEINKIYDLAYNLWWSWSPDARELFNMLGGDLWVECGCNPVKMLNSLSSDAVANKCKDENFIKLYNSVIREFEVYMNDKTSYAKAEDKSSDTEPIAYFSMEYGLHECMPIYSGGLGVLSGDHLKSASDINIPLIGVGLFYRETYFKQVIDHNGYQQEEYIKQDRSMLPMKALLDENANEAKVCVQLPGRNLYLRVWVVNVGRIKLYLLDSDCEENELMDKGLTARLYGGDRRTRIKQEIALGIGGVRLLRDVLKLSPSVYHLNEGHCAFSVLERMHRLMKERGLNYQEAREAVKASTVFTTHTPVPAGNEVFEFDLLKYYLYSYVDRLQISWEEFIELGCENHIGDTDKFSMTVLALKLSSKANGVAKLHGVVSRNMWQNVWKGVNEEDLPIFSITNGIHTQTWLSNNMRKLFNKYTQIKWGINDDSFEAWEKVQDIPNEEFWAVKLDQKQKFIDRIKNKIRKDYAKRGESKDYIEMVVNNLRADVLTIGFARRFATYKRSDLFLRDWERIVNILSNDERPVQIIVAGKAHPQDIAGKEIIERIVVATRDPRLRGRVVFLENYDMGIGRLLTRGVDVWMNNPVRPHEASGTSGMKVCPNLGINFSILDGWWDEGYSEDVGFKIDSGKHFDNRDYQDDIDNKTLLDVLENQIIPMYYARNDKGYSDEWFRIAKNSVKKLSPYFSTQRMLKEYYDLSYEPTALRANTLFADDYKELKALTSWKRRVSNTFSTVQIVKLNVEGISSDLMPAGGTVVATMLVNPGRLNKDELLAEFVLLKRTDNNKKDGLNAMPLEIKEVKKDGSIEYTTTFEISESGNYSYAVRIMPYNKHLASRQETGLICWG
ncbi:MAG: alpha-glucan family phosphorylase [Bdellovibrionota bacterium]